MIVRDNKLQQWLVWLENYSDSNIVLGLDRILPLAKKLNLTTMVCPVITVAGTNGKGSTVAVIEAVALAANMQVGSYTSPHMFSFTERIKINGNAIAEQECIDSMQLIRKHIPTNSKLTYFEVATLTALATFKNYSLDLIVLEVGLGGRLDAVNVVDNEVSIITSIALEHCQYLGDTIDKIAYEKAGIIKANSTVVCGSQHGYSTIKNTAIAQRAKLKYITEDFLVEEGKHGWSYINKTRTIYNLPLLSFPVQNAACAIMAIDCLRLQVTEQHIKEALLQLKILGRFQIYNGPCEIIFDVAHNPEAAMWLASKLIASPITGTTHAIVGICANKNWRGIIQPLLHIVDNWYTINTGEARLLAADLLANYIATLTTRSVVSCNNVTDAIKSSIDESMAIDRIIIFGSFFTVAEALKNIYGKNYQQH